VTLTNLGHAVARQTLNDHGNVVELLSMQPGVTGATSPSMAWI
jgi:hypothetical protein